MSRPGTARFRLLGTPVRVAAPADVVERLRACYPPTDGGDRSGDAVEGEVVVADGGYRVAVAGGETAAADLVAAVRALNHELLHAVMRRNLHLFFVHAGVVRARADERAIVLPGLSRAGKSTLVLALVMAGCRLLSDELLAFDPATGLAHPFARAIKVRDECVGWFPRLRDRFVGDGEGRFLPFAALPAGAADAGGARPALLAAPRWDGDSGDDRPAPISRGQGLLHLADSALNFGADPQRGLDALAAIADRSACYALRWRDPHAAAAALLRALGDRDER